MYPSAQSIVLVPRTSRRTRRHRCEAVVVPDDLPVFSVPPVLTNVGTWNDVPFQLSLRFRLVLGFLIVLKI